MLREAGVFLNVSGGQGEEKCRALTDKAFRPNATAVPVNDALDGSKSNPRPFELFGAMEALERAKQISGAFQIETDSIVPHQESLLRSEERRVGKECRGRWGADDEERT